MEDILASIKRIIADDLPPPSQGAAATAYQPSVERLQPPVPQPRTSASAPPPWPRRGDQPPPESILELTDRVAEPIQPRATPARAPEPAAPVQRAVERLRQAEAEMPQPQAQRPVPRDLMPRTPTPRATGGDVTLEALAREMLQPMLAEWIEQNLPEMVERLVQAEIRRMSDKDG